ncbi:MAG: hypothetical protein ACN4GR_06030 [Arenicellales bacterium]
MPIDGVTSAPPQQTLMSWGGEHQDFVIKYLVDSTVDGRHSLMSRILYSPAFTRQAESCFSKLKTESPTRVPQKIETLLQSIDASALVIEQNARQRNLTNHVSRASPRLSAYIGKERLADFVSMYSDTPFFWMNRGRTLAENFSLYLHWTNVCESDSFFAALVKFDGVTAGIGNRKASRSPWTGESTNSQESELINSEIVYLAHALLAPDGELISPDQFGEHPQSSGQIVSIQLRLDGSIDATLLAMAE